MVLRSRVSFLLLAFCAAALAQTPSTPAPTGPRIFRDASLGITYFYPRRFTPEKAPTRHTCAHATIAGSSVTPVGSSSFVFSNITSACPSLLREAATDLDAFTSKQALGKLKVYGKPEVARGPAHYTVNDHPASVTIAVVKHPVSFDPNSIAPPRMTFVAEACVLGEVPDKRSKASLTEQTKHVVCFDFTTQHKDLLPLILAFTVQFDGQAPEPLVPGGILH